MNVPTRVVSSLAEGTALSRFLICSALGGEFVSNAIEISRQYKDSPTVTATLEAILTKAAVAPGSTTDATWAAPLAQYGIAAEALALLRGASIIGQLAPKMRRVPFHVQVPRETGGGGTGGAWVAEGLATPVAATAYDTLTQEYYKSGKIVVLSRELLKLGDPDVERTVRETVIAGLAAYLDTQFLTNTVTLSANLRPAAITNGATAIASTGTTTAQITADLAGLLAAVTSSAALVWIMRAATMARIGLALGVGAPDLPRTLLGIPILLSDNSPQQVTLVDAAQILYSDDGAIALSTSQQASLQMDSAPTNPPVAATVYQNLFELNLFGVRAIKSIAYLRAQSGAVAYMTTAY